MKQNSKHAKSDHKDLSPFPKDPRISYTSLFKHERLSDSTLHSIAGILTMSEKVYWLLSRPSVTPKAQRNSITLPMNDSFLLSHKSHHNNKEYYNNLALKSENTYLKSHITELEDDIKKLYDCNQKMVKLNKNLELKVNFYQKKVHCFTDVYNQQIENINVLFKKISTYLLDTQQGVHGSGTKSPVHSIKDKVKSTLHMLFNEEMTEMKLNFKNLQKQIDVLNDEYLNLKQLPEAENNTSYYISKIIDSISSNPNSTNSETKSKSTKQNETILQSSINQTRKPSTRCEEAGTKSPDFFKYDLPLSHRSGQKQKPEKTPQRPTEKHTPSSAGKETVLEISLSPQKETTPEISIKPQVKDLHIFNRLQRKHAPPPKNILKNEIQRRLAVDKAIANSRHSSINQISCLSNSGLMSQRGSVKSINQSNFASLNMFGMEYSDTRHSVNSRSRLSGNSTERGTVNNNSKIVSQAMKRIPPARQTERPESARSTEKYSGTSSQLLSNLTSRTERTESTNAPQEHLLSRGSMKEIRQEANDYSNYGANETMMTGRDSYDNLKSFRKLIQNFRLDLNKVAANNEANVQKTGLYKEISMAKSKR